MLHADTDRFELFSGNSKFFDISSVSSSMASRVIRDYLPLVKPPKGQPRTKKTVDEWKKILKKYANIEFPANSILIPINMRKFGRVHVSRIPLRISTNFSVFSYPSINEANVIASYMTTIFFQLECEIQSKDFSGARKTQLKDVVKTHVPNIKKLSSKDIDAITAEIPQIQYFELKKPKVRKIDEIWADILFGKEGKRITNDAITLLKFLANRRSPEKISED